jgi:hypothetical protein
LIEEKIHEGPYPEYRYRLTEQGREQARPRDDATHAIEQAVSLCLNKTGSELSQLTHDHSRSWNAGKNGDILNIDIDLIPEDEYVKREEEIRHVNDLLGKLFPETPV